MSKRPQTPTPPGQLATARRSGKPSPYKPPVQSPDADTVMLASFTAERDQAPGRGRDRPADGRQPAAASAAVEETPGPSTRVFTMPRGKRDASPVRFSESSARRTWVSRAVLAVILCVQAALSARLHNTAFDSEALFLYAGHQEIGHLLHGAALQGNYASYFSGVPVLYPVLAAAADSIGGLEAARLISLLAMLTTTALLYSMTRRLFNERIALCAVALFCVTESTVMLGSLATNDAASLCLLALASWIVVRTAPWRWRAYLLAAPIASLAVAADYWALLYLPTLALLAGLAAHPYQGRPALLRTLVFWAVTVELFAAAIAAAGGAYVSAAVNVMTARTPGPGQALHILAEGTKWGGILTAVAVVGAVGYAIRVRNEPNERIALPGSRPCRIALGTVLAGTALLTLLYQVYLNTDVSLDTRLGFGLFFAAPMAGAGLARLVGDHFRRAQVGIVVWAAALAVGLAQAAQIFGSWPDSAPLVSELSRYLQPGGRYLIEDDNIPIYYLMGHEDAQADQFTSTYNILYRDRSGQLLSGTQGFLAAVRAGYFRVIIYNKTVTPGLDTELATALQSDPMYRFAGSVPETAADFRTTCYVWVRT
jgi:hypothetical protein